MATFMSTYLLDVTLALEFNVSLTVIKLFKKQMQLFDC